MWMVIFHLVVNLTDFGFDQKLFYWVPLGFMLFLGVILGQFLASRPRKTAILGAKLLGIFLVMNIPNFVTKEFTISQLLVGDQQFFSFEILLPMSIVAFASIGMGRIIKKRTWSWILGVGLIAAVTSLSLMGEYSYNFSFFVYGIVGHLIGENLNLDRVARTISAWWLWGLGAVIAGGFYLTERAGITDLVVIFQVLALYVIVARIFNKNRVLSVIGKHSFLIYVGHIVLIKVFS